MQQLTHSRSQTLHDHIKELRSRLLQTGLLSFLGAALGYVLRKPLIALLQRPLHETLYYTSPAGGFSFIMKICLVVGLVIALPLLVYHLISFIQPAFSKAIRPHYVRRLTALSVTLAIGGAVFGFVVVVPMSLHFFQSFQVGNLKPLISAADYLNFVLNCIITFMLIFQIPLIMLFIDRIKPLPPQKLLKYEKFVIVGSLVLALILPFTYDPLTQFLLALPIIVLYNLSILLLVAAHKVRPRRFADRQVLTTGVTEITKRRPTPKPATQPLASTMIPNQDKLRPSRPMIIDIVSPIRPAMRRTIYMDSRRDSVPLRTNFLDLRQSESHGTDPGVSLI